jgi:hypothetical protein
MIDQIGPVVPAIEDRERDFDNLRIFAADNLDSPIETKGAGELCFPFNPAGLMVVDHAADLKGSMRASNRHLPSSNRDCGNAAEIC